MTMFPVLNNQEILERFSGRRVRIFVSDHKWAVVDYNTGERLCNTKELTLVDVGQEVDSEIRAECLRDRKRRARRTHAWIVGTIAAVEPCDGLREVDYDPYFAGHFFYTDDKSQFRGAKCCRAYERFEVA